MNHTCHWFGCNKRCPPIMWGCKQHWFSLPKFLRDAIWREYKPGQEITKTPSLEYILVAKLVDAWVRHFESTGIKLSEKELLSENFLKEKVCEE